MPPAKLAYKRVVLKISGEGFCKQGIGGIDGEEVASIASRLKSVSALGAELAVVVGGGNLVRGAQFAQAGVGRATADHMGMLATVINALALQGALEQLGAETRVATAIAMEDVAEPYIRRRCMRHLEKGRIVILAGGTGNPYFTTDTAAALRATEIGANLLLKATKVDGVYSADPRKDPNARFYSRLSYMDVLSQRLQVMDSTAISLCMENNMPIMVINLMKRGNIEAALKGEQVGTLIHGG
jgi:uridylate kinase